MSSEEQRAAHLAGEPSELTPQERAELDEVRAMLADEAMWEEPAPDLEDRVVAAVAAASAGSAGSGGSAASASPGTDDLGQARQAREASRSRRGRAAWMLAAAAVALVAGVLVGIGLDSRDSATESLTVALSGTELAPDARGSAELSRFESGWRVRLDVSGLPRRDDGDFYEAWLRSPDDTLVSVGTFNEADDDLVLWSGVSPRDFPALTVTRESDDGDPASSGERVLTGELPQDD